MIEVLYADGRSETLPSLSWPDLEKIIGGSIQRIEAWQTDEAGKPTEPGERVDLLYNRQDFERGTPLNLLVVRRFSGEFAFGTKPPFKPPGGNWIVASGKDRLPVAAET